MEEIFCCGKLPPSENEGRFLRSRRIGPEEAISFSIHKQLLIKCTPSST
jgi:hypothetical protein